MLAKARSRPSAHTFRPIANLSSNGIRLAITIHAVNTRDIARPTYKPVCTGGLRRKSIQNCPGNGARTGIVLDSLSDGLLNLEHGATDLVAESPPLPPGCPHSHCRRGPLPSRCTSTAGPHAHSYHDALTWARARW